MSGIEIGFRTLSKRHQADGQHRTAFDPYHGFRTDQLASRPEQGMAVRYRAHRDPINLVDRAHQQQRLDTVNAVAIGPEGIVSYDQGERNRVDSKDERPFLGHDVKQIVDAVRLYGGNDGGQRR